MTDAQQHADGKPPEPASTGVTFDPNATCAECGVFGAYDFAGTYRCTSCYAGKCSCCPEFGQDDLWEK